jgi:hypothetical protein
MSNKNEKRREKREWVERRKRSFSNCIAIEEPILSHTHTPPSPTHNIYSIS